MSNTTTVTAGISSRLQHITASYPTCFLISLVLCVLSTDLSADQINPYPRQLLSETTLLQWDFSDNLHGWQPLNHCTLIHKDHSLNIIATGNDPYMVSPIITLDGVNSVKLHLKNTDAGRAQIFWITKQDQNWSENKSVIFDLEPNANWHYYTINLPVLGQLKQLRFDPGYTPGQTQLDLIQIVKAAYHPLELSAIHYLDANLTVELANHSDETQVYSVNGVAGSIDAHQKQTQILSPDTHTPFLPYTINVKSSHLPPLQRTIVLHHQDTTTNWISIKSDLLTVKAAPDGSGAEIFKAGKCVAILAPLAYCRNKVSVLELAEHDQNHRRLSFQGDRISVSLTLHDNWLKVSLISDHPCQGPVLRALGPLEQGLLCGLEYLGKGEKSSSKLDLETEEHCRYSPDPMQVTLPLMACVTPHAATALLWQDMTLQPVFASPNFFDGTPDHRMSLTGKNISAKILVSDDSLEEVILWAVKTHGLPDLPPLPRNEQLQNQLCIMALESTLSNEQGWGHCAGERWPRQPFADHASTLWRLTGKAPELDDIVPKGAHIANDAIYFVTGKVERWLAHKKQVIQNFLQQQQADGSFHYQGKYLRGHFEDTASGYCAFPASRFLEYAHLTGDDTALSAGLKTLEYMKRFRTPRGAQTWELSLHTPDILASAYLVWAYVRGYELTGNSQYLRLARKWALTGIPFVYLWGDREIMAYATIAVYGATNWRAPNWIGLPVQWCGTVYAYALLMLAEHDDTLDWKHLAEGIVITAEQMQYTEGASLGCLPDAFVLISQLRVPADINPCALVSLRLALAGKVDNLLVTTYNGHRITAPFRLKIKDGIGYPDIDVPPTCQVLLDGENIVNVTAEGRLHLPE